jgi:uncharacterized membrane protein
MLTITVCFIVLSIVASCLFVGACMVAGEDQNEKRYTDH